MPCAPHPLLTLSPAVRHEVRVVTVGPRRAAFGGADGPLILHLPSFFRPRGPSDAVTPIVMHPPYHSVGSRQVTGPNVALRACASRTDL